MSLVLSFKCTRCKEKCTSKGSWLRHLLEPRHRDLARKELIENWRVKKWRKSLIVVFSKQPMGKDVNILKFFSKNIYKGIVTGFVWWEERPGVGFIQFESKKVVKQVIGSLTSRTLSFDGQEFLVKAGKEYLELEWDELLPLSLRAELDADESSETKSVPLQDPSPRQNEENVVNDSSTLNPVASTSVKRQDFKAGPQTEKVTSSSGIVLCGKNPLLGQILKIIQEDVEIPDEKYNSALKLLPHLNNRIRMVGRLRSVSELSAHLFRNWSLKLHYNSPYYYYPAVFVKLVSPDKNLMADSDSGLIIKNRLLATPKNQAIKFQLIDFKAKRNLNKISKQNPLYHQYRATSAQYNIHTTFSLYCQNFSGIEAQLWSLAKYLLSFDWRASTLMQVVYFWANVNSIGKLPNSVPDPSVLTWMVLYFLYDASQGEKIIPTPVEILSLPHKPIYIRYHSQRRGSQIDVGFQESSIFRDKWIQSNGVAAQQNQRNDSDLEIFKLVHKFFSFWGSFYEGSFVIDARHGKHYRTDDLLKTKHSIPEVKVLQESIRLKRNQYLKQIPGATLDNWKIIYLSSPFCNASELPINSDSLLDFTKTSKKLEVFLNEALNEMGEDPNLNSVKALFKV